MSSSQEPHDRLSVVVASWHNAASLRRCLQALAEQRDIASVEVVVATNFDGGVAEMIRNEYPGFVHVELPADTTVPELRAQGIARTSGSVVALTEDNCIADPRWCAEIASAHQLPYAVIGGSVDNLSTSSHLDWAVYFYEYGRYMPPNVAAVVGALPGNNVSYKRAALSGLQGAYRAGFFETFIHQLLVGQGHQLYMAPLATVCHIRSYSFSESVAQCYHHGRSFAAMRVTGGAGLKRVGLLLGSPLLPALLTWRIVASILRKGRNVRPMLLCLPHLMLLMTSWACGEVLGYLLGAGSSARRWR